MTTLNHLAANNPSLANNPYLRGLRSNYSNSNNSSNSNRSRNSQSVSRSHSSRNNMSSSQSQSKCLNAGNEWIIELLREKREQAPDSKQMAYSKAIRNIKKTPFLLCNEHLAMQVNGVGKKFASMIKKHLIQNGKYQSQDPNQIQFNARRDLEKIGSGTSKSKGKSKSNAPKANKRRKKKLRVFHSRICTEFNQ